MLKEAIEGLKIQPNKWYIDCNLGGGGHTEAVLKKGGKVLGIDIDPEAVKEVAKNHNLEIIEKNNHIESRSDSLILFQANFAELKHITDQLILKDIKGILFDLGVSSSQLDTAERGFSFIKEAPLDMRMNQNDQVATAADLVNGLHEKELAELFLKLGEENFNRPIAKKIVEERKNRLITTTVQLANIIESVKRKRPGEKIHPATKVFQALRIAVNDELNSLKKGLLTASEILDKNGRLVVISFHSLEDRIVKQIFKELAEKGSFKTITPKPLEATDEEKNQNPRSRSAKIRIAEKI